MEVHEEQEIVKLACNEIMELQKLEQKSTEMMENNELNRNS